MQHVNSVDVAYDYLTVVVFHLAFEHFDLEVDIAANVFLLAGFDVAVDAAAVVVLPVKVAEPGEFLAS